MSEDIVERLRKLEALKAGDMVPPELYDESGSWAALMSNLCGEAADEIERLRGDVVITRHLAGFKEITHANDNAIRFFDGDPSSIKKHLEAKKGAEWQPLPPGNGPVF